MTNTDTLRTLKSGRPVVHVAGSGMPCRVLQVLGRAGKLNRVRTGSTTVYTLKGEN